VYDIYIYIYIYIYIHITECNSDISQQRLFSEKSERKYTLTKYWFYYFGSAVKVLTLIVCSCRYL
jgi:hypothetical protein